MRTPLHPAREDFSLPNILYALGDPGRLKIVQQLAEACGDLNCHQVGLQGIPKSTGSHQLKVLREAGLVHMTPQGRMTLLVLRRDDLEARYPGLLDALLKAARSDCEAIARSEAAVKSA